MTAYGEWVRASREALGLSREQLRRRMLLHFETAPTLSGIRDLENGIAKKPSARNRVKYERILRGTTGKVAANRTKS